MTHRRSRCFRWVCRPPATWLDRRPIRTCFSWTAETTATICPGNASTYVPANGYAGTASSGGVPSGVIPTPIESIEEFKVGTANQTADFNGAAGSQVQMVTKRGTNQFHGALYEYYFGSDVGAANLWRNNHTPDTQLGLADTPLPASHRNRFGGALGGPLDAQVLGRQDLLFHQLRRLPVSEFDHGRKEVFPRL